VEERRRRTRGAGRGPEDDPSRGPQCPRYEIPPPPESKLASGYYREGFIPVAHGALTHRFDPSTPSSFHLSFPSHSYLLLVAPSPVLLFLSPPLPTSFPLSPLLLIPMSIPTYHNKTYHHKKNAILIHDPLGGGKGLFGIR